MGILCTILKWLREFRLNQLADNRDLHRVILEMFAIGCHCTLCLLWCFTLNQGNTYFKRPSHAEYYPLCVVTLSATTCSNNDLIFHWSLRGNFPSTLSWCKRSEHRGHCEPEAAGDLVTRSQAFQQSRCTKEEKYHYSQHHDPDWWYHASRLRTHLLMFDTISLKSGLFAQQKQIKKINPGLSLQL